MTPDRKAQWQIHFCVVLWGFTAILGKLITLPALALVWWRMLIVVVALAPLPMVWRGLRAMSPRLICAYSGIGCLVALHWLTFYGAIKLANASVAATCMGLGPAFLAVIEPWIAGTRFDRRELALGILVIPGVALVAGGVPDSMHIGLLVGVMSAFFVAVFGALNKRLVERADPMTVTGLELGAGVVLLTVLAPMLPHDGPLLPIPDARDGAFLLVLAIGCTLLPYTVALVALRRLSAFYVQLATNLEPIYAIALAIVLLGEQRELGPLFYAGVIIILVSVFAHPLLARSGRQVAHADVLAVAESKNLTD